MRGFYRVVYFRHGGVCGKDDDWTTCKIISTRTPNPTSMTFVAGDKHKMSEFTRFLQATYEAGGRDKVTELQDVLGIAMGGRQ